eukprot:TRINITY_DN9424_c0_g1_i1.p1 TRINITY_DN9424_c0_g1~~TRINITY_DN9424_c0_g1_i1.p1  ORF type:complete len:480 (+),score=81.47 TRINITY_DN9424_c0_g1_i1:22-1461(+)
MHVALLNFLLYILLVGLASAIGIVAYYVARYQWKMRIIGSKVMRHPTKFAMGQKFDPRDGSYDGFLQPYINKDETVNPVMNLGWSVSGDPVISFSDPDVIKEVLCNTDRFPKYAPLYNVVKKVLGEGMLILAGDQWKHHRRMATPLFHYGALKAMMGPMERVASEMCRDLETLQGQPISTDVFQKYTMKVIIAAAFGEQFDHEWMASQFHLLSQSFNAYAMWHTICGRLMDYLPIKAAQDVKDVHHNIRTHLVDAIAKRRSEIAQSSEEIIPSDLLTLYIMNDMDDSAIIEDGLIFLFAGSDTTSVLLSWACYYLSTNPDIQSKVREEITQATSIDDLAALRYSRNFLLEILRLRPPVPTLDRYAAEDCVLAGQNIPQGTCVFLNFHVAHLDDRYWKDPFKFDPSRFDHNERQHPFAFVPFSAGERNCIGQKLGMQEALIFLRTIVSTFEVSCDTLKNVSMAVDPVLKPTNLNIRFTKL